jgi:hypothetical protein
MEGEKQPVMEEGSNWKKQLDDFLGQPRKVKGGKETIYSYEWHGPEESLCFLTISISRKGLFGKKWIRNLEFQETRSGRWHEEKYTRKNIEWIRFDDDEDEHKRAIVFSGEDEEGSPAELKIFAPAK